MDERRRRTLRTPGRLAAATSGTLLIGALALGGCLGRPAIVNLGAMPDDQPAGAQPAATAPAFTPFSDKIPGTALALEMVPVPGGNVSFDVDGEPQSARIGPFWVARLETTWELYDAFVFALDDPGGAEEVDDGTNAERVVDGVTRPSRPYVSPDRGYGHKGFATISVSYRGAKQFCTWLTKKTGRHYRLPTEAEWRFVCDRSGLAAGTVNDHAWHDENAEWSPHPVGKKKADALGLHDLWGNVREWCTGVDGKPVALGGSFIDLPGDLGCAARAVPTPDWQMTDPQVPKSTWWLSDADFVGFRVVCEPGPVPEGESDEREE